MTEFSPDDPKGKAVELHDDGDIYQGSFEEPDNKGRFYYTVYMKWNSDDTVGEVYYDFSINVK